MICTLFWCSGVKQTCSISKVRMYISEVELVIQRAHALIFIDIAKDSLVDVIPHSTSNTQ